MFKPTAGSSYLKVKQILPFHIYAIREKKYIKRKTSCTKYKKIKRLNHLLRKGKLPTHRKSVFLRRPPSVKMQDNIGIRNQQSCSLRLRLSSQQLMKKAAICLHHWDTLTENVTRWKTLLRGMHAHAHTHIKMRVEFIWICISVCVCVFPKSFAIWLC